MVLALALVLVLVLVLVPVDGGAGRGAQGAHVASVAGASLRLLFLLAMVCRADCLLISLAPLSVAQAAARAAGAGGGGGGERGSGAQCSLCSCIPPPPPPCSEEGEEECCGCWRCSGAEQPCPALRESTLGCVAEWEGVPARGAGSAGEQVSGGVTRVDLLATFSSFWLRDGETVAVTVTGITSLPVAQTATSLTAPVM